MKNVFEYLYLVAVGVLIGMFILTPTAIAYMTGGGSRDVLENIDLNLLFPFDKIINYIAVNPYILGMYSIGICALLGSIMYLREKSI